MFEIVMSGFTGKAEFTHKCSTFQVTDKEIILHGDCLSYRYSRKYYDIVKVTKCTERRNDGSNQENS